MWTNQLASTSFALLWLILFWGIFHRGRPFIVYESLFHKVFSVVGLAFLARIVPALLLPVGAGYDIGSFQMVGEAYVNGQEVYSAVAGRHPYLPFQLHIVGWSYWFSEFSQIPFVVALKLPLVVADSLLAGAIVYVLAKSGREDSAAMGLMYAFNPAAIFVCAYHGQFEAVTLLLLFFAWGVWHLHRDLLRTGLLLGFAILNKSWPIVLFPLLFVRLSSWRERVGLTVLALGIPAGFTALYLWWSSAPPELILLRTLTHTGNSGWWGMTALLFIAGKFAQPFMVLFELVHDLRRWLLLLFGLFGLLITYRQSLLSALVTTMLLVFAVTAGIGVQWVVWIIPFAIVDENPYWVKLYTAGAVIFLIGQNYGMHMYSWASILFDPPVGEALVRLSSLPAWIIVVVWAVVRVRRLFIDKGLQTSQLMMLVQRFSA